MTSFLVASAIVWLLQKAYRSSEDAPAPASGAIPRGLSYFQDSIGGTGHDSAARAPFVPLTAGDAVPVFYGTLRRVVVPPGV